MKCNPVSVLAMELANAKADIVALQKEITNLRKQNELLRQETQLIRNQHESLMTKLQGKVTRTVIPGGF